MVERIGFMMKLKEGCIDEYKKRHDQIWPELVNVLREAGISDYSIFVDEATHTLYASHKLATPNTADQLPEQAIVRKWWDYFSDIMEVEEDNTPVIFSLKEVFYMP